MLTLVQLPLTLVQLCAARFGSVHAAAAAGMVVALAEVGLLRADFRPAQSQAQLLYGPAAVSGAHSIVLFGAAAAYYAAALLCVVAFSAHLPGVLFYGCCDLLVMACFELAAKLQLLQLDAFGLSPFYQVEVARFLCALVFAFQVYAGARASERTSARSSLLHSLKFVQDTNIKLLAGADLSRAMAKRPQAARALPPGQPGQAQKPAAKPRVGHPA